VGRGVVAGWIRALLRVPLFYKILVANAALVILGAVAGTLATADWVRVWPRRSTAELAGFLAAGGVVISVVVNAVILRLALGPLALLERTAEQVRAGDLEARAPRSPLSDRELDRLTETFNAMLDTLDAYRGRLRDTAARALSAAEEERKRIARELHDETAQTLAALLLRVRLARSVDDRTARDELLEDLRTEISTALEGIRRFARGLRPPALDELGLVPAIGSHARNLEESAGITITLEADPLEELLPPEGELALYRIVQEALANVVRHAAARRVRIRLAREHGHVVAEVEDDGRGFRAAKATRTGAGLGLFGMHERAAYLGGRVEVHSVPGQGTRVRAEVPISGGIHV
jgi:two-component system sensor histidine kinase UhpB